MSRNAPGSSSEAPFLGSPKLTESDIEQIYADWNAGRVVRSGLVAIGQIALSGQERDIMDGPLFGVKYEPLSPTHRFAQAFQQTQGLFAEIVAADISRGGLGGVAEFSTAAGFYRSSSPSSDVPIQRSYPHTNAYGANPPHQVHYAVGFGAGLPIGFEGDFSKSDIYTGALHTGELIPGALRRQEFAAGTVVRYVVSAHGSGDGMGTRLVHSAALTLPQVSPAAS